MHDSAQAMAMGPNTGATEYDEVGGLHQRQKLEVDTHTHTQKVGERIATRSWRTQETRARPSTTKLAVFTRHTSGGDHLSNTICRTLLV